MPSIVYPRQMIILLLTMLLVLPGTGYGQQAVQAPAAAEPTTAAPEAPSYGAMADLLENDAARQKLIEQLRALADGTVETDAEAEDEPSLAVAVPLQVAAETRAFAGSVANQFREVIAAFQAIDLSARTGSVEDFAMAAFNLGLVIAATLVAFFVFRKLSQSLFARVEHWTRGGRSRTRALRHTAACLFALLVDLAVIGLAWLVGYATAFYGLPESAEVTAESALFLNAFVIVEGAGVVLGILVAGHHGDLRLLRVDPVAATYWRRRLDWLIGFIGYGLLAAVPLISDNLSVPLGQALALAIVLLSYVAIVILLVKNRKQIGNTLRKLAKRADMTLTRILVRLLARVWLVLALAYFTALVLVAINDPEQGLPYMAQATLQTLLAIGLGALLSSVLTRLIGHRIRLPETMTRQLPSLEQQINRYVPTALKVVRVITALVVIAVILDAWRFFDLGAWLISEAGIRTLQTALTIALILLTAAVAWLAVSSWIEHRLSENEATSGKHAREKTLLALFRSTIAIVIVTITLMVVLSELGINIAPLIASAGVLGLAIGFGAQKLVQDVITGVFIQLENAISIGDVVTVGGISGEAEKLSIRSLGIRDLAGTYHIVPFSSVDVVSNFMRGFAFHLGEYGVAYREDTDEAIVHLQAAFEELRADPEHKKAILADLEVHGITALADSSVTIRVRIKTLPGLQWGVGRAYNRLVKRHFDAGGIEIPFPHTTLYFGQNKEGDAPPAPVEIVQNPKRGLAAGQPRPEDMPEEEAEDPPERKTGRTESIDAGEGREGGPDR